MTESTFVWLTKKSATWTATSTLSLLLPTTLQLHLNRTMNAASSLVLRKIAHNLQLQRKKFEANELLYSLKLSNTSRTPSWTTELLDVASNSATTAFDCQILTSELFDVAADSATTTFDCQILTTELLDVAADSATSTFDCQILFFHSVLRHGSRISRRYLY